MIEHDKFYYLIKSDIQNGLTTKDIKLKYVNSSQLSNTQVNYIIKKVRLELGIYNKTP